MKNIPIFVLIISFPLIAMEIEFEALPCSRWESFWLNVKFDSNGLMQKKEAFILKELAGRYTEPNLSLMRMLICANKQVITRKAKTYVAYKDPYTGHNVYQSAISSAFGCAIRKKNIAAG